MMTERSPSHTQTVLRVSVLLVCLATANAGAAAGRPVVRADGRIGPFRIDRTTEAQLRATLGRPTRAVKVVAEAPGGPSGRTLLYRCGRGCRTDYSFNSSTGKLSDFQTSSPRFVTERGSHVGMKATEAARRERAKILPSCGDDRAIHVRWDLHHALVLLVWHGKVDMLVYLGPHSIFYEGLC
jgi:hypothetical protein